MLFPIWTPKKNNEFDEKMDIDHFCNFELDDKSKYEKKTMAL